MIATRRRSKTARRGSPGAWQLSPPPLIVVGEAVAQLAPLVFPEQRLTRAKNTVRECIRYARDNGHLPAGERIDGLKFYEWAIKKWPVLAGYCKMATVKGRGGAALSSLATAGEGSQVPQNPAELATAYIASEGARRALQKACLDQEATIAGLRADLDSLREKQVQLRRNKSDGAREGWLRRKAKMR
jgi:hypothetical protein